MDDLHRTHQQTHLTKSCRRSVVLTLVYRVHDTRFPNSNDIACSHKIKITEKSFFQLYSNIQSQ